MAAVITTHAADRKPAAWGEVTMCPMGADGYHVHGSYSRCDRHGEIGLHARTYATQEAAQAAYDEQCDRLDRLVTDAADEMS